VNNDYLKLEGPILSLKPCKHFKDTKHLRDVDLLFQISMNQKHKGEVLRLLEDIRREMVFLAANTGQDRTADFDLTTFTRYACREVSEITLNMAKMLKRGSLSRHLCENLSVALKSALDSHLNFKDL